MKFEEALEFLEKHKEIKRPYWPFAARGRIAMKVDNGDKSGYFLFMRCGIGENEIVVLLSPADVEAEDWEMSE